MITASIDVIVQAARLRDGSRRITHITEVLGMEGDVIITQDVFLYDIIGEDANGNLIGRHRSTGIGRPQFWERARYFGEEKRLGRRARRRRTRRRTVQELERAAAMPMETLALFSLVAVAFGGLAWVFIYPILSGEREAEAASGEHRAHRGPPRAWPRPRPAMPRRSAASRSRKR